MGKAWPSVRTSFELRQGWIIRPVPPGGIFGSLIPALK